MALDLDTLKTFILLSDEEVAMRAPAEGEGHSHMLAVQEHNQALTLRQYCQRLVRALAIVQFREGREQNLLQTLVRFNNWLPILAKYNPRFPTDCLPLATALCWECNHMESPMTGVLDVDFIWDCLPDLSDPRLSLSPRGGFIITASRSKHGSSHIRISCPNGIMYPCIVSVQRFCDMDEQKNHGDECPSRLPEDDEEYSDDCCCESWVEAEETLTLTEEADVGRSAEDVQKQIRDFLQRLVWDEV